MLPDSCGDVQLASVVYVQVLWSDIGGEEEIKEKLRDSVDRPLKYPEVMLITEQAFSLSSQRCTRG